MNRSGAPATAGAPFFLSQIQLRMEANAALNLMT